MNKERREKGIGMQCAGLVGSTRIWSIIASVCLTGVPYPASALQWFSQCLFINVWQNPPQYCKVISLQLKEKKRKKKTVALKEKKKK